MRRCSPGPEEGSWTWPEVKRARNKNLGSTGAVSDRATAYCGEVQGTCEWSQHWVAPCSLRRYRVLSYMDFYVCLIGPKQPPLLDWK